MYGLTRCLSSSIIMEYWVTMHSKSGKDNTTCSPSLVGRPICKPVITPAHERSFTDSSQPSNPAFTNPCYPSGDEGPHSRMLERGTNPQPAAMSANTTGPWHKPTLLNDQEGEVQTCPQDTVEHSGGCL